MTKPERRQFIFAKIGFALRAIQNDQRYDWNREPNDTIGTAAESLGKTLLKFIDGKATEEDVKPLYKAYVGHYAK